MKFSAGETVYAFVKLGSQKKERWTKVEYHSKDSELAVHKIHYHGQYRTVENKNIRQFVPCPDHNAAEKELIEKGWAKLVEYVTQAANALLPSGWNNIKIDEEQHIISFGEETTIVPGVVEHFQDRIGIGSVTEIPAWVVQVAKSIPATRESPEDVTIVDVGYDPNPINAAALFVDTYYKNSASDWWYVKHEAEAAAAWEQESNY